MAKKHSKKRKQNKTKLTVTLISLLCVAVICGGFLFVRFGKKETVKPKPKENKAVEPKQEEIEEIPIIQEEIEEKPVIAPAKKLSSSELKQVADAKQESDKLEKDSKTVVAVKTEKVNFASLINRSKVLNVKYLCQNPELPTGCEITSLTTVLNFYGYTVTKVQMSSNEYLDKGSDPTDWREKFFGEPSDPHSFGCYAKPITVAANRYLSKNGGKYIAKNMSGSSFEKILKEVDEGRPVVLWGTSALNTPDNQPALPHKTIKRTFGGKDVYWIAPEHCYVLIGYDVDKNIAVICDPQRGIVRYKLDIVANRYKAISSQCVFIVPNPDYKEEVQEMPETEEPIYPEKEEETETEYIEEEKEQEESSISEKTEEPSE
ncbi:MAG: C39 family peptidase [Clostridia bacterium]|nr:C39 family peptidase [Clostridia bacterium]